MTSQIRRHVFTPSLAVPSVIGKLNFNHEVLHRKCIIKFYVALLSRLWKVLPILAGLFYRQNYIELIGTGVKRIFEEYKNYSMKLRFEITDNAVAVILPSIEGVTATSSDEEKVIEILKGGKLYSCSEIAMLSGFSRDKTIRLANSLVKKNDITKIGIGRSNKYKS